jgi:hypothetical protein
MGKASFRELVDGNAEQDGADLIDLFHFVGVVVWEDFAELDPSAKWRRSERANCELPIRSGAIRRRIEIVLHRGRGGGVFSCDQLCFAGGSVCFSGVIRAVLST